MRGYNRAVLMGNVVRDPDIRFTPNKQKVARMTIAIGREWKNKGTNARESHTDFVNVVAWSFLADLCERYLKKGRPVLVEGRISVRNYDDQKSGQKRQITEIVADNVVLLGGGNGESNGYAQREPKAGVPGDMGYTQPAFDDELLDLPEIGGTGGDVDIPF